MGYYTYYSMEAYDAETANSISSELEEEICKRLYEISGHAIAQGYSFYYSVSYGYFKWYDHEADMIALSKEYPNVVFVLDGEGEERDDNWRLFVHNGETELVTARIIYDSPTNQKFWKFGY